jgi:septum formation protein
MPKQSSTSFILASASPRRKELLAEAGYEFKVSVPAIDESAFSAEGVNPREYAERLALAKAKNVAGKFPKSLVVGTDTVVDFDGEIIGKPSDAKEAEQITRKLFGKAHKVITAVAVVRKSDGTELVESDSTTIYPKKMSDEQIAEHIKGKSWQDKAGAYAIREDGDEFIERIEGSLTNVMGLPMELLGRMLGRIID